PLVPNAEINAPVELLNCCILWLVVSLTQTFVASAATPVGALNWPLRLPFEPIEASHLPRLLNFTTLWLLLSATHTFPDPSMAIPCGELNWPSAEPEEPQLVMNVPAPLYFATRLLLVSAT